MLYVALALTIICLTSLYLNYLFLDNVTDVSATDAENIISQSEAHQLSLDHDKSFRNTEEEDEEPFVRVAIHDGRAYWVNDAGLQWAPIDENDEVEYSLQQQVDVHSMTQPEVDLLLEILDALKEDRYEGGSSGQ